MVTRVESLGLKPTIIRGTERTVVAVVGDERAAANIGTLERDPGVDEVFKVLAPYKLASLEVQPTPTVVTAGSLKVGGSDLAVMAGPCSVEDEEQITMGQQTISLKFSADYVVNNRINLKLFYDQVVTDYVVSSSFPTSNTNVGVSLRFTLMYYI